MISQVISRLWSWASRCLLDSPVVAVVFMCIVSAVTGVSASGGPVVHWSSWGEKDQSPQPESALLSFSPGQFPPQPGWDCSHLLLQEEWVLSFDNALRDFTKECRRWHTLRFLGKCSGVFTGLSVKYEMIKSSFLPPLSVLCSGRAPSTVPTRGTAGRGDRVTGLLPQTGQLHLSVFRTGKWDRDREPLIWLTSILNMLTHQTNVNVHFVCMRKVGWETLTAQCTRVKT